MGSLVVARSAVAQVGYEPEKSPYRDVEYRQGVTAFAGWFSAALDPARVVKAASSAGARLLVTADHGNCEMMIDPATGGPHTAHTTSPVPLVVVDPDGDRAMRNGGALCDVGPTILSMLGIERPVEMTGTDLRLEGTRT